MVRFGYPTKFEILKLDRIVLRLHASPSATDTPLTVPAISELFLW